MPNRIFDDEEIKGYEDLHIDVYFTPAFQTLLDVSFAGRAEKGATDLSGPLKSTFLGGFFSEKADFDSAMDAEEPLRAEKLGKLLISAETTEDTTIQILQCNLATVDDHLRQLHARLQPLLLFFVDAATQIDSKDPGWDLLLAVETNKDGSCQILGFATLYNFWVFPDRRRVRISQVLVLPPQQGRGVGSLLVEAAYKMADEQNAVDITMEDATDEMMRLRDKMDLKRMLAVEWAPQEALNRLKSVLDGKGAERNNEGNTAVPSALSASPELLARLRQEFRISRQQAGRMWEGLLYAVAVPLGDAATAAVAGLVGASLESQVAAAKKESQGKLLRETKGGFVMTKYKSDRSAASLAAPGAVPVEGVTSEQQQDAIREAVAFRVEELQRLVGLSNEEDEEDGEEEDEEEEEEDA